MATTDDISKAVRAAQTSAAAAAASASQARASAITINQMVATALFWMGTWTSNVFYPEFAVVLSSDILYVSLKPGNKGNTPASSPSWWQEFGSASAAPGSSIAGLDFHLVSTTPTLRETPAEIVTLVNGLNAGLTSDGSEPMLQIAPDSFAVNLGSEDQMFLGLGSANIIVSGASGEIDIFGQVLQLSSNSDLFVVGDNLTITGNASINMTSNTAVNINGNGGGTVTLGEAGDTMVIGGINVTDGEIDIYAPTIKLGGANGSALVSIGQGLGDNINIATNSEDSLNAGLTSDASSRMLVIESELFSISLGPDDEFSLATVDFATRLDIRAGQILLQAGGSLAIGENSDSIGFFGSTPVAQQVGGDATASDTYGTTEQTMLQTAYSALRTYGLLS